MNRLSFDLYYDTNGDLMMNCDSTTVEGYANATHEHIEIKPQEEILTTLSLVKKFPEDFLLAVVKQIFEEEGTMNLPFITTLDTHLDLEMDRYYIKFPGALTPVEFNFEPLSLDFYFVDLEEEED